MASHASSQTHLFDGPPGDDSAAPKERLAERLKRIEALLAGATSEGERVAAEAAQGRVAVRLAEITAMDPPVDLQFTFRDPWCRKVFLALLRRQGIRPYRYRGQRGTTVMARMPRRFLDEELWPEYQRLSGVLRDFLERLTGQVVAAVIGGDGSEPDEATKAPRIGAGG